MTRKLLYILFASAMLMGGNFKAAADPIIEVNAIDFNQVGIRAAYYRGCRTQRFCL